MRAAHANGTTTPSAPSGTQVCSRTAHRSGFQLRAGGRGFGGTGGAQTQGCRRTGKQRCGRRTGAPPKSLATCDASSTRLPIATTRNLRHPIVWTGSALPPAPPPSPTFCRSLRSASTAGRPPPALCKAKEDALLGLEKRDNTSQPAPRFRAGVLQKDANGDPRERHFHM